MLHCCLTLPFLARNLIFVPLYILWVFLPSVLLLRFCYNCFELCDCDRSWCRVFFVCVCVCISYTGALLSFFYLCNYTFHHVWKIWGYYFFNYLTLPPQPDFQGLCLLIYQAFEVLQLTAALLIFSSVSFAMSQSSLIFYLLNIFCS